MAVTPEMLVLAREIAANDADGSGAVQTAMAFREGKADDSISIRVALAALATTAPLQARVEELEMALEGAVRAANLALFVIRKQGVMPNGSWERGFEKDLAPAIAALNPEGES